MYTTTISCSLKSIDLDDNFCVYRDIQIPYIYLFKFAANCMRIAIHDPLVFLNETVTIYLYLKFICLNNCVTVYFKKMTFQFVSNF